MCAAFKKEGHKLVESSRTTRVIFHHLCVYCVWRGRGEEEIFFSGGWHGSQGRPRGDQSSPTEFEKRTIEKWLPINCQWGVSRRDHKNITEPHGWNKKFHLDTSGILQPSPPQVINNYRSLKNCLYPGQDIANQKTGSKLAAVKTLHGRWCYYLVIEIQALQSR